MKRFLSLTKIEYDNIEDELEESPIFVNVAAIAYVESKVVHLINGESFLCKESYEEIIGLMTE